MLQVWLYRTGENEMKTKSPRKQRKAIYTMPLHMRNRKMTARLSPDLASEYEMRNLPVREGDTVLVATGSFKDTEGKVIEVDRKNFRVYIKEVAIEKADGSEYNFPIAVSRVMITKLEKDKWRDKAIARKTEMPEEEE